MIKAGVDWGSSSYRAYKFDPSSNIVETLSSKSGLKYIGDSDNNAGNPFEAYLFESIGHWLTPGDTVLLSGMVTSRSGWQETPYLPCPADLSTIADQSITKTINGVTLIFLPGLSQLSPSPDVIRGEELQMLGACQSLLSQSLADSSSTEVICVLPGTHSKWARLENGNVQRFHTIVTGELYELLTEHSLIGAFATEGVATPSIFTEAVTQGFHSSTLVSDLFSCRSGILLDVLQTHEVRDRLSGLLIGHEIREGLSLLRPDSNQDSNQDSHSGDRSSVCPEQLPATLLGLIGSDQLCTRYLLACQHLSIDTTQIDVDAAALGFQELIRRMGQS